MSISDRLEQIEARAQAATPAQAETSLSMDGFNMHEDYPEYGQEANEAFAEFVRGQIEDRFGGGCSAHMDTFTREVDQ